MCVFLFAAVFLFLLVSHLMFESISFRGFYWGPRAGVDLGPLPVSFVVSSSLSRWMPMHRHPPGQGGNEKQYGKK